MNEDDEETTDIVSTKRPMIIAGPTDKFDDPQAYLTRFLAQWRERTDDRTRINSYEELDFVSFDLLMAKLLGLEMYEEEAIIHMRLKISKDGDSRNEAVLAMRQFMDMFRPMHTGSPIMEVEDSIAEMRRQKGHKGR